MTGFVGDDTGNSSDVIGSIKGLRIHLLSGVMRFDRETPVRHLASATLRGLTGHALKRHCPELVDRLFKPGVGGQTPPAYCFQPLHRETGMSGGFPFRVITYDPGRELLPAIRMVLDHAGGIAFGGSGSTVAGVEWHDEVQLGFEGVADPGKFQKLTLATPLRLSVGDDMLTEETLTLGHVVQATVRRLNLLSRVYGNGVELDGRYFLVGASFVREVERVLRSVSPKRWSSTQEQSIELGGVVGHLILRGMGPPLASLLSVAEVLGVGKHTAEGCGLVLLEDT